MKFKMINFPQHCYNVTHTSNTYVQVINDLSEGTIIKIQHFSENYTWLLLNEIMSIHWTQEQVTVYQVVILRKVEDQVREDHFVFISSDLKHDIPFAEICNTMIHKHYADRNILSQEILNSMMGAAVNRSASMPSPNSPTAEYKQQDFVLKQVMANPSLVV